MNGPAHSRLRALARPSRAAAVASVGPEPDHASRAGGAGGPEELCELCAEAIGPGHRHLVDVRRRKLLCACRACAVLFDRREAAGGRYRLLPTRVRRLDGFRLDDAFWASLRIPVDMAFFHHSTPLGRVAAFYPSPLGPTESLLELERWEALERANPVLLELEPDVEALLVNRTRGAREHWWVPVDRCYELVGVIRTRWKGLGGGAEVWEEIARFFRSLEREAGRGGGSRAALRP